MIIRPFDDAVSYTTDDQTYRTLNSLTFRRSEAGNGRGVGGTDVQIHVFQATYKRRLMRSLRCLCLSEAVLCI